MKTIKILLATCVIAGASMSYNSATAGIVDCSRQDDFEYLGMLMQRHSAEAIVDAITECNTGSAPSSVTPSAPSRREKDDTYEGSRVISNSDRCLKITQEPDGETTAVRKPNCTHYNEYGNCLDTIRRYSINCMSCENSSVHRKF